jgi:alpha-N-arabinofuranosidase
MCRNHNPETNNLPFQKRQPVNDGPDSPRIGRQAMDRKIAIALLGLMPQLVTASEFHVAMTGSDNNSGTKESPLRSIQRAAELAQPGDVVTVHEGLYRERVNPPRGGSSETQRIVYQAAPGANVEIKGSEVVKGWVKVQDDLWTVTLPNSFFGGFNPFADEIKGDWFEPRGRKHHTGAVYLNGEWLTEAAKQDDVMKPVGKTPLWFGKVEGEMTTLWAQFKGVDPNEQLVEVNVRRTVFYPDQPGRNFITVRGFTLRHAATPWAPPTAEQIGLIGTHWSKGWIIEDNTVSHSACTGITLGKHGDEFDNSSADTAEGYVKTIERAHAHPIAWTKENIGRHIVCNNRVSHCEQAGIVGSLGAIFSVISDNIVHDIHVRRLFGGAEQAGIKIHAAIDAEISRNHIYHTSRGLWLDWMAQGARVTGNLLHDNLDEDIFLEVNHGPFLVDNNLLLSRISLMDWSQGGAYAHNLFTGSIVSNPVANRSTPWHPTHSTMVAGLSNITGGDSRFYNNIFVGAKTPPDKPKWKGMEASYGLAVYDSRKFPIHAAGNVYLNNALPYKNETDSLVVADTTEAPRVETVSGRVRFTFPPPAAFQNAVTRAVTTDMLGNARIPNLPYVNPDGTPLKVDTDFFGKQRDPTPTPGPFENRGAEPMYLTEPSGKLVSAR